MGPAERSANLLQSWAFNMQSEAAQYADLSVILYAQCWEDADILLEGLAIKPGDTCLSIASAGDNSLAMLAPGAGRVIVLDMNPSQLACLELRVAAYRELEHQELLELIGSRPSMRRSNLYRRCRPLLSVDARNFWDAHASEVEGGIGGGGKFERYFALFRKRIMPLIHSRAIMDRLLAGGEAADREEFYHKKWDTWRWRMLFRIFCSRFVMGRLGRDSSFFRYVEGSVAERILPRTRHALTVLDPADNPYLQWILNGCHTTALPFALRPENFEPIRNGLDRLEWHCLSLEEFLLRAGADSIDRFNLSDVFEYMSEDNYLKILEKLVCVGKPSGRLAYWNMLVPRSRPESMSDCLKSLSEEGERLFKQDKAFFYSAFVLEEIVR
jgi:S-adenosylmethionine-diacylglycerol 3-amino-3-carboxypropyl transferase